MVLLSVVGSFFAQTAFLAGTGYIRETTRREMRRVGSIGLERMVREIRTAASPTGLDVLAMTASEFSFRDRYGDKVSYLYESGSVKRNTIELIESVNSFAFSYYERDATVCVNVNDLHSVGIEFSIARNEEEMPFRGTVFPQNFTSSAMWWSED